MKSKRLTKNKHPEDVKALVRKTGSSFAKLATKTGLTHSAFSHAVRRCIPTANIAIATQLKTSVHDIWPEWFDKDNNRRSICKKTNRFDVPRTSQKSHARTDMRKAS